MTFRTASSVIPIIVLWFVASCVPLTQPIQFGGSGAQESRVEVGPSPPPQDGVGQEASDALRRLLETASERFGSDENIHRDLVLSGAVTNVEHISSGPGLLTVRATVSLSISDAQGGQILVVVEGTAQSGGAAPEDDHELRSIERQVVVGAAEGLLNQLEPQLSSL